MNEQINRRSFARVKVGAPCVLYMNGIEVIGSIYDISETGICIKFDEDENNVDKSKFCEEGTIFEFASIDDFENLERKVETAIFSGSAKVIWSDNENMVGCQFTKIPSSLENYIKNKKISVFIKNGFII